MATEKFTLRLVLINRGFDLARDVVRAVMYVGCTYLAVQAISILAGKKTEATLIVSYFISSDNTYGLPWLITVIAVAYAYAQYRLRRRTTEYLQARVREFELKIDPTRTSSGLKATGETNPKDKM